MGAKIKNYFPSINKNKDANHLTTMELSCNDSDLEKIKKVLLTFYYNDTSTLLHAEEDIQREKDGLDTNHDLDAQTDGNHVKSNQ